MSTNTDGTDTEYNAFDTDLPTVQIPLGRDQPGLTVEGQFIHFHELPDDAKEAYKEFVDGGKGIGQTTVHMCDDCADRDDGHDVGYLTTSDNIGSYKNGYECSRSWTEETTPMNGATAGMWGAHRSWCVNLNIDGDDKRVVSGDEGVSAYTLEVRELDRYHADADVLGETTVTLPDDDGTVTGEVNGKSWEADVRHQSNGTIEVQWRRVTDAGDTVTYAYEEGERGADREFLERNPVAGAYAERDDVDVKELTATVKSRLHERECGNSDRYSFTEVWPPGRVFDDEDIVPLHDLSADDVPNSASHLSRIQNQSAASVSQGEMLRRVATACKEFWETHGSPEWVDE